MKNILLIALLSTSYSFSQCLIQNVSIDTVSACDPASNSYTVTITTTFTNPGDADELVIGGFGMPNAVFPLSSSPQTEMVTIDFDEATTSATNLSVSLTSTTNANFSCINPVISNAWTAPDPCGAASLDELDVSFRMFPNPADKSITIELNGVEDMRILNQQGRIIKKERIDHRTTIDLNDLESGIYFIQTTSGSTQKFIKL